MIYAILIIRLIYAILGFLTYKYSSNTCCIALTYLHKLVISKKQKTSVKQRVCPFAKCAAKTSHKIGLFLLYCIFVCCTFDLVVCQELAFSRDIDIVQNN